MKSSLLHNILSMLRKYYFNAFLYQKIIASPSYTSYNIHLYLIGRCFKQLVIRVSFRKNAYMIRVVIDSITKEMRIIKRNDSRRE